MYSLNERMLRTPVTGALPPHVMHALSATTNMLQACCTVFPACSRLLNVHVDVAAARALSCMVSLETVDLSSCQVAGGALKELMWMPKLQRVVVSGKQRGELRFKRTQGKDVVFE